MTAEFDAIIVGGGPAGASAAVHLAASGARVLLAERERFPRGKLCGEVISPRCPGLRARVTLDATGRHRAVVRRAVRETGREVDGRREGRVPLVAFKAHLEGARGAEGVCEIYFYPGGYGGLSPVEKGLSNLCFIARAGDVRACESDPERVLR